MKKIAIITITLIMLVGTAYACFRTKQCCKRNFATGNLECVTVCDYQFCPLGYDIVIQ